MSPLRLVYLGLAIWGAIHPMYWFVTYMRETGTGLSGLIDAWYVNASTTGLTWDLTIAAIRLPLDLVLRTRPAGPCPAHASRMTLSCARVP